MSLINPYSSSLGLSENETVEFYIRASYYCTRALGRIRSCLCFCGFYIEVFLLFPNALLGFSCFLQLANKKAETRSLKQKKTEKSLSWGLGHLYFCVLLLVSVCLVSLPLDLLHGEISEVIDVSWACGNHLLALLWWMGRSRTFYLSLSHDYCWCCCESTKIICSKTERFKEINKTKQKPTTQLTTYCSFFLTGHTSVPNHISTVISSRHQDSI